MCRRINSGLCHDPPAPDRHLRARGCPSSFFAPARDLPPLRMRSDEYFPGSDSPERVPPFLTALEVCRILRLLEAHGGVEKRALRALRRIVESGRLTPIRLGKFSRYRRDDVMRLAAGN